jgi:NADPH:quinone reductase-like Zn-dependent oxidoreductase
MGRDIDGSYAEYVRVPETNVVPIESKRDWVELAAIPESFATAWAFLRHNLELRSGQTLVVRGGTSALGQAAIQLARSFEARVFATTRSRDKAGILEGLGAEPLLERPDLSVEVRARVPAGVDAVFELVGVTTLVDSLKMVRYRGRVAMGGFLGGQGPIVIDPLGQFPSGAQLSFLASPFVFGTANLPMSEIPFADFVARAERGEYKTAPAHVFDFGAEAMVEAHRLIESGAARGKIVARGTRA